MLLIVLIHLVIIIIHNIYFHNKDKKIQLIIKIIKIIALQV
jgi:hypothetical protein